MDTYILTDNIKLIMFYSDIKTLINTCLSCKILLTICDKSFWLDKFSSDDLQIINSRTNFKDWTNEYIAIRRAKYKSTEILNASLNSDINRTRKLICINIDNFYYYGELNFLIPEIIELIKSETSSKYSPYQLHIYINKYDSFEIAYRAHNKYTTCQYRSLAITFNEAFGIIMKAIYINYPINPNDFIK